MDDLSHRVSDGFNRIDADLRALRGEMSSRFERVDDRFERVDDRFDRVDDRFDRVDARFDALQRTIIQIGGGMIATFVVGFAGLIAAHL